MTSIWFVINDIISTMDLALKQIKTQPVYIYNQILRKGQLWACKHFQANYIQT